METKPNGFQSRDALKNVTIETFIRRNYQGGGKTAISLNNRVTAKTKMEELTDLGGVLFPLG